MRQLDLPTALLMYWLLLISGRRCIPNFTYVSAYVVTTQAEQLSARTFQRSMPCRPASKAHTMEAHRACDAVHWRVAPTGHARAARKKRMHVALKNGKIRDFWPFNGQFLGIEPIDPPFLLVRSGPTAAAHLLAKFPQNVTDRTETPFLNYSYRYRTVSRLIGVWTGSIHPTSDQKYF